MLGKHQPNDDDDADAMAGAPALAETAERSGVVTPYRSRPETNSQYQFGVVAVPNGQYCASSILIALVYIPGVSGNLCYYPKKSVGA